jgi:YqaJ-like viral recombinase domain
MYSLLSTQGSFLWRMFRLSKMRISSSELASLLDVAHYKSKYSLIKEKSFSDFDRMANDSTSVAIRHGQMYEMMSIGRAKKILDPEDSFVWKRVGSVIDRKAKVACSPDAVFWNEKNFFGLEVKTPYSKKLPETVSQILPEHILQCLSSIHVVKAHSWFLFYFEVFTQKYKLFQIYGNSLLWDKIKQRVETNLVDLQNPVYENKINRNRSKEARLIWEEEYLSQILIIDRTYPGCMPHLIKETHIPELASSVGLS